MSCDLCVYWWNITGSPGRRLTLFSSRDVSNTTTLLLSEDGEMLYVGARDAVLALDVRHKDAMFLRSKVSRDSLTLQILSAEERNKSLLSSFQNY